MTRPDPDLLHPRLTVVPVVGGTRLEPVDAPGRTVVGREALTSATLAVAERRRVALRARIDELRAELRHVEADRVAAEEAVEQRLAVHAELADAAAWCEVVPALVADLRREQAQAEAELGALLRESREAARALDRVLEQRASADVAIAEARRQLRVLEAGAQDPTGERHRTAAALAEQAEHVEARLAGAETDARARAERTKRSVSEAERAIEHLAADQRRHLARLHALVDGLPGDARPPRDDDPIHHVDTVAAGLRSQAEVVEADLPALGSVAEHHRADAARRQRDLANLERSLERIAPEDVAEALADVVTGITGGLVVLDDVVAPDGDADDGLLRALETSDTDVPLVLLSADPAVLGWAIDLPATRGAVVGPGAAALLTVVPPAELVPAGRPTAPSLGDLA